jgi:integrase
MNIQIVSKLLRHTSLKHTQIYALIVDSLMNNAKENFQWINLLNYEYKKVR